MGVLDKLEPNNVFRFFEEISRVPRGSYDCSGIADYLEAFAKERELDHWRDEANNVIIIRPASTGYESSDTVMLQGHVDMVCEKNSDSSHNFKRDPLNLCVMDDYVYARGTTLGADDGIAVAFMLAILDDASIEAPRLECVFTTDEEVGMLGAHALDTKELKAKTLLNLDSEHEGQFLTNCAGGLRADLSVPVRQKEKSGELYSLVVCGFKGGHSGTEIHKYLGNANIIMGRLLHYIGNSMKFSIVSLSGGLMDNAIPREASADILVQEEDISSFEDIVDQFEKIIRNEYRPLENNIEIYCNDKGLTTRMALTQKTQERIIFLLNTMPDGVQKMSLEMPGLVQTSLNLGIIRLKDNLFMATSSVRSAIQSEKEALSDKLRYLCQTIGGTYSERGDYPSWEYREDSRIQGIVKKLYKEKYGKEPELCGIHAGVECGILSGKMPELDIISYGPDALEIHTPRERLSISSTERVFDFTKEILRALK